MARLLVVVPARGGSKRLPGKNLRLLAGRPLLAYTADALFEAEIDAPCLLTTDDDGIAEIGSDLGWLVPFRRPPHLSDDAATTADTVLHAVEWYAADSGHEPDAVMVLQPTSPLRGGGVLRRGLDTLDARPDVNAVIAVSALHVPPSHVYTVNGSGTLSPLAMDDRPPPVLAPNGALYITRTAALQRERSLYAGPLAPVVLESARAIDIDTDDDLRLAEALLAAGGGAFTPHPSLHAESRLR